jgi:hypothetical protein
MKGDDRLYYLHFGRLALGTVIGLTGGVLLFAGASVFVFAYLRGDFVQLGASRSSNSDVSVGLMYAIDKIVRQLERRSLRPEDKDLAGAVGTTDEGREEDHAAKPQTENASLTTPEEAISLTFGYTRGRLREEIQNLSRRSSVNLVIGVMVTVAATGLLAYLVSREHGDFGSVKNLLSFYIPRITTVVLIETFAYFFLKLYRQNLEEIKYYQNELTTLAAQEIAWRAAVVAATDDAKIFVIQQLAKSDRNCHSLVEGRGTSNMEFGSLLEVLQTVCKLIVSSAKAKE